MYWKNQGISPCEFMGLGRFRNNSGTEITNTSNLVNRGYKADTDNYGYRHNGGNNHIQKNGTFIGGGGSGAYGGQASGNLRSGAGGGSGYTTTGLVLQNQSVTAGATSFVDFDDLTFSSATFSAAFGAIYNDTNSDKLVVVLDFGGTKTATNGDFKIVFPATGTPSNAIISLAS